MKWSLEKTSIAGGFALTLLLTGTISFISYQNANQVIESTAKVQRTRKVLNSLTDIFATLVDSEAGRKGYLLSRDTEELERYNQGIDSLNPKLTQLEPLIPEQSQRLSKLKALVAQRISLARQSLASYQQDPSNIKAQIELQYQIKKLQGEIRSIITQIQTSEEQLLQQWVEQFQANLRTRLLIEGLSTFLSFGIIFSLFALLYRQLVKRKEAETLQLTLAKEKELSELKLRFFSLVSHEFRTPLSIILGSAQLLAESKQQWQGEKKLKNLNRIQSSARLMTQLLTDILTLTRAEAGKLEFNPDWVELESFCLNLIADLQLDNNPENPIQFVSQGSCGYAWLDEKLLYSILSNLVSNAIKYSPLGKPIDFTLICESEAVIFQIKDRGIGISKEAQKSLFEPFYRAENVGITVGTGLGLAVVKKCVELHQGEILVESEVGVGTTFTVKIPMRNNGRITRK
jgi:signal transduction histidine kinase